MRSDWPEIRYSQWRATCDTLHAHTQVLGKLAVALAPPEPQLQHAALRLTARGWETAPLPAPDGSGAIVVVLDLRRHEAVAEHSDGRSVSVKLGPDRAVGAVTRELLGAVGGLGGRAMSATTRRRSTPTHTRPLEVSRTAGCRPRRRAGSRASASSSSTQTTPGSLPTRGPR
jgi:hypothetical protein